MVCRDSYSIDLAKPEEAEEIFALEAASFPADEAATLAGIRYRIQHAGEFFLVVRSKDETKQLIGFVNGTCTSEDRIVEESMSTHDPSGHTLVIHSVVTRKEFRRSGLGLFTMAAYMARLKSQALVRIEKVLLLCKAYLLSFYLQCGFQLVGLSPVEHGQDQWFEMSYDAVGARHVTQLQVDAFAPAPFGGNPAAVVFLDAHDEVHDDDKGACRDDAWMQKVAAENNLSETAFVTKKKKKKIKEKIADDDGGDKQRNVPGLENEFEMRWFTPTREVEMCGHATLAAAHALFEEGRIDDVTKPIQFYTKFSGLLTAEIQSNGKITLYFPSTPPRPIDLSVNDTSLLLKSFSPYLQESDILFTGRSKYDLLVEVTTKAFETLRINNNNGNNNNSNNNSNSNNITTNNNDTTTASSSNSSSNSNSSISSVVEGGGEGGSKGESSAIDFESLRALGGRGVLLTCLGSAHSSDSELRPGGVAVDFLSRGFFPRYGINEDPVTGSAHCALAPYWISKINPLPSSSSSSLSLEGEGGERKVQRLRGFQASARGGVVEVAMLCGHRKNNNNNNSSSNNSGTSSSGSCEVENGEYERGGEEEERVELSGTAFTVMRTKILV